MSGSWDSILLIGLSADAQMEVEGRARAEVANGTIVALDSLDEALNRPEAPGREVLVLSDGRDFERALSARGRDALPRWPVLVYDSAGWDVRLAEASALFSSRREVARAHGDLLSIARRFSHEIRSPLGCILTSAEVLREEFSEHSASAGELTETIVDSANEVFDLVKRVSLLARASAVPFTRSEVNSEMAVWVTRERLATRIANSGTVVTESEEWPNVVGIQEWVERIWFELIANAVQHAGPEARVEMGWEQEANGVRFFVKDHGGGIAPELREILFRPFHRLHESDAGRGLGLAIVQRLVDLQEGSCGYEPVLGGGSCFYFALPGAQG
jgi:signal transduction histidine kinase